MTRNKVGSKPQAVGSSSWQKLVYLVMGVFVYLSDVETTSLLKCQNRRNPERNPEPPSFMVMVISEFAFQFGLEFLHHRFHRALRKVGYPDVHQAVYRIIK